MTTNPYAAPKAAVADETGAGDVVVRQQRARRPGQDPAPAGGDLIAVGDLARHGHDRHLVGLDHALQHERRAAQAGIRVIPGQVLAADHGLRRDVVQPELVDGIVLLGGHELEHARHVREAGVGRALAGALVIGRGGEAVEQDGLELAGRQP